MRCRSFPPFGWVRPDDRSTKTSDKRRPGASRRRKDPTLRRSGRFGFHRKYRHGKELLASIAVASRGKIPYNHRMKAGDFIDAIKELGKRRGVKVLFDKQHGKGSHGSLWYGTRKTTVKQRNKELGKGLLSAMLH
jgi:mRNA interferase HicA